MTMSHTVPAAAAATWFILRPCLMKPLFFQSATKLEVRLKVAAAKAEPGCSKSTGDDRRASGINRSPNSILRTGLSSFCAIATIKLSICLLFIFWGVDGTQDQRFYAAVFFTILNIPGEHALTAYPACNALRRSGRRSLRPMRLLI